MHFIVINIICESILSNQTTLIAFRQHCSLSFVGRVGCGGYASTDYVTDIAPAGFPAVIKKRISCTWSLIKPLNKRAVILKFAYFDVVGTGSCIDNRVEVYNGYTRIASLCSVSGGQRTFHLRENFNRMKLIVNRPWNFRGFHATIKAI